MSRILILNGPNLNLLGRHKLSDTKTIVDILKSVTKENQDSGVEMFSKQFNSEEKMIELIHENKYDYIIGNFSSYQRTGIAIRDAILSVGVNLVEVKMTNLYFNNKIKSLDEKYSCFSEIALKVFWGVDDIPYINALKYVLDDIKTNDKK